MISNSANVEKYEDPDESTLPFLLVDILSRRRRQYLVPKPKSTLKPHIMTGQTQQADKPNIPDYLYSLLPYQQEIRYLLATIFDLDIVSRCANLYLAQTTPSTTHHRNN